MPISPVPKKKLAQAAVMYAAQRRKKFNYQGKKRGRKPKSTQVELTERRQMVLRMRLQGKTFRDIGKELGLGYMTVKRDLDAIKCEVAQKIDKFDRDYALGKSISVYEQIEEEAWAEYHRSVTGSPSKAQFLNLVRTARNDQVKLLADVGLIDRAPAKVQHKIETNKILEGWTDDARRIVSLAIIRAQMDGGKVPSPLLEAHGGGNGHGKVVDVPAEVEAPVGHTANRDIGS
jgi:hypothetical protein